MTSIQKNIKIELWAFASPVYWKDEAALLKHLDRCDQAIRCRLDSTTGSFLQVRLFSSLHDVHQLSTGHQDQAASCAVIIMAMSGGVQPWIMDAVRRSGLSKAAFVNAYIPEFFDLPEAHSIADPLLHRNAHPATTDSFAQLRLANMSPCWLFDINALGDFIAAAVATSRLAGSRLLIVGETEPWVTNSTRNPVIFKDRLGMSIVPISQNELIKRFELTDETSARQAADSWRSSATSIEGLDDSESEIIRACRLSVALRRLIEEHNADGAAIACFDLIGKLNTTSCLAVSMLNDTAGLVGGCEGDLDAAATLMLLKSMNREFVWVANPIIRSNDQVDLVHCTAPRCACGSMRPYRLLRHHESGKGVSPEVCLPDDAKEVTLVRIGNQLSEMVAHAGLSLPRPLEKKLCACHTQLRVRVESSQKVVDSLLGTHFVVTYGNILKPLKYISQLTGLQFTQTSAMI